MIRSPRHPSVLVVAVVVITAGLAGVLTAPVPAPAAEVVVPRVRLFVSPHDRAPLGTEVDLLATVDDALVDPRITGTVVFLEDGVPVAEGELALDDDVVVAAASYTPAAQGVHELTARYEGNPPEIGASTSGTVTYSVLPETCPDQATPGAGAVVRLAYLVVLDRCPDPAGFTYWTGRLVAGAAPGAVARALALSTEGIRATVDAAYQQVLDRRADAAGRAVWAAKLRTGWTTSQLWAALAASPEMAAGATDPDPIAATVQRAFTRIVGRAVDPASATYWSDRLAAGASRSATLRALILTPEALTGIAADAHQRALGRPASPSEVGAAGAAVRVRRGDWRLLAAELLGWSEASAHAQRYPDTA